MTSLIDSALAPGRPQPAGVPVLKRQDPLHQQGGRRARIP